MKALQAKGADLPATINASFFRGGAANFMALFMPAEFVAHLTGHNLNGRSALYEYLEVCRALLMPGALVLAGWPALPWGQLGRGAAPASFEALEQIGVGMDVIEPFVVHLFHLDSSSPAPLLPSGGLWKATLAAAATLVMYYVERHEARKMPKVTAQMRDSFGYVRRTSSTEPTGAAAAAASSNSSGNSSGGGIQTEVRAAATETAHEVLSRWSGLITTAFNVDNLHLTAPKGPAGEGAASVVAAVDGIASAVAESRRAALDLHRSLEAKLRALTLTLERPLVTLERPLEMRAAGSGDTGGGMGSGNAGGGGADGGGGSSARGGGADDAADEGEATSSSSKKRKMTSSLLVGFAAPSIKLKKMAVEIFLDGMSRHGNPDPQLTKGDKARAKGIIDMFKAFATQAEVNSLLPPAPGQPPHETGAQWRLAVKSCSASWWLGSPPPIPNLASRRLKASRSCGGRTLK